MKFSMLPGRCFRQLMDGWEGRGRLSWLWSCEVTSIYCWKMFVQENLKGKCKDKASGSSGFLGIWNLLKENTIWPLHVYAFKFRIYLRMFSLFWMNAWTKSQVFLNMLTRHCNSKLFMIVIYPVFAWRPSSSHWPTKMSSLFVSPAKLHKKNTRTQFPAALWGGKTPQQNGPSITSLLVCWGWVSASPIQIQVPWIQQRLS